MIELLVVVSLIALLIGLLLPVLGGAREASRGAVCLSNMRQMGIAVYAYSLDYDDLLPSVGLSHSGLPIDQGAWLFALSDYVDGELLYRCPSDQSEFWKVPVASISPPRLRQVSYATNYQVTDKYPGFGIPNPYRKLSNIPVPSSTIYTVELTEEDNAGFAVADHVHSESWFGNPVFAAFQIESEQHAEQSNYLLLDGHAARYALEDTGIVGADFFNPKINLFDPRTSP